ncbi:Metabotropic glutamate receptor 3 [Mizuhopecten yessoensis]|uniref:Metabotropic glutamate receptor 3 n=1 Tax=Mizuhopecten yessoensis TaxID=6573 RepID=A0A210PDR7_MIZYE|nr:Metabotropic glutamate receptor 3 [Mizuhopecten yessoensis]
MSQSQNITINPDNIDVYIGAFDTDSSIRVADIVNPLGIPQISYGSTSQELMDQYKYRYFLRTVPADDKQARAIISYLKRFDLNNVQVITSYDSIGVHSKEEFARLARLNRICISQNITTGVSGSISVIEAHTTLNKLFSFRDATVVILFVQDPETLLQSIENRDDVRNNFTFIGTDKLGFNHEKWNNARKLMNGRRAVTFDIETADVPEFDKYLENKNPENYFFNPWFDDYYQELFQCNFDGRSTKYPEPCPTHLLGIPRAEGYIQDPYVLYVINAVFSAVFGVDKALREICPSNSIGVCNLFRTSGERRQRIMTGIQATNFVDATQQPFFYEEGGDSSRGYKIWEPLPSAEDNTQYYLEDVSN